MSGLLVIFILAAVALIIELTETQRKIEEDIDALKNAVKAREVIVLDIINELKKYHIDVETDVNKTLLRIPESTLSFKEDSDHISNKVRDNVLKIGAVIHQQINKPFDDNTMRFEYLDTVFIEGHTDSLPSRRFKEKGNWGLSTYRAISLWQLWDSNLEVEPKFQDMINGYGNKLFSVSGYAASRRVQLDESTKEKRRANRRIDIRFTVKRPKIEELEAIVER